MNDHRVGKLGLHPTRQAVLLAGVAPRHAQQAAGFVDNDQLIREMKDGKPAVLRRTVNKGRTPILVAIQTSAGARR
jgi:hypothetical protein